MSNSGPQVQQAGKKDDTDRKIEKFEAAKRVRVELCCDCDCDCDSLLEDNDTPHP